MSFPTNQAEAEATEPRESWPGPLDEQDSATITSQFSLDTVPEIFATASLDQARSHTSSPPGASADSAASTAECERSTLYLKNVSFRVTDGDIREQFASVGCSVKSIRLQSDKPGGFSTGYVSSVPVHVFDADYSAAFIEFHCPEDATKALLRLQGARLMGRRMKLSWAKKNCDTPSSDTEGTPVV